MAAEAGPEFVEGWLVAQVLGEGAYGEVRLLLHARTGAAVALKAVRGGGGGGSGGGGEGAREAALHRALRHPHVLRCLGERAHHDLHYMFLEYAQGGELFDRIEPDVGMPEAAARRYYRQLLAGLQYLHGRGVAHRDIKPENLLLDHHDNVKISDFGMATLFRHGPRERLLSRVCGTLPYAAPEVLQAAGRPYRAPPADLWAAALVLLAMLAGELPWERATKEDAKYCAWVRWTEGEDGGGDGDGGGGGGGDGAPGPCGKLSAGARALVRRALWPRPEGRATLRRQLAHRWLAACQGEGGRAWRSQPAPAAVGDDVDGGPGAVDELSDAAMDALLRHSQPAAVDDLLPAAGPPRAQCVLQRLVRRMTRVQLPCAPAAALRALAAAAARLGYTARRLHHPHMMAVECGSEVRMRAWATGAGTGAGGGEGGALLEVRRSRGCGLEFKRCFLRLRRELARELDVPLDEPLGEHTPYLMDVDADQTDS